MPAKTESRQKQGMGIKGDPSIFTMAGAVEFAAGGEEKESILLTLYDGSIVAHWYWGNLAFELKTMKMAKKRNPILYSHDTSQRIAYSDEATFEDKFTMEGKFLNTPAAMQLKEEMEQGFPFEASLRFDPERTKIERVAEGQEAEVNGRKLKGPGTVMKNAVIMEGSVCVFGALKNTNSEAFEILDEEKQLSEKENIMPAETETEKMELTAETFASEYPELHKEVTEAAKAEGVKETKELFGKFAEKFGDDPAFCIEQFKAGVSMEQAVETENAKLKKEAEKKGSAVVDPAKTEFSDEQQPEKNKMENGKKTDEQLNEEFEKSEELKTEFGEAKNYIAYVRAEENGQVGTGSRSS